MRVILASLFLLAGWLPLARADEPSTFCGRTVDGWLEVLRDKTSKPHERDTAIRALGCFGPDAKAAVPDILQEMRRIPTNLSRYGYQSRYYNATDALIQIGRGAEVAIPYLIEQFLKDGSTQYTGMGAIGVSDGAKSRLVKIGAPAVPGLREVMKGPDTGMRVGAAEALGELGLGARDAIPDLIRAVEHPEADEHADILQYHAIQALGRMGPEAKSAIPILNEAMDKDEDCYRAAVVALTSLGEPPVQKLLEEFREGDHTVAFYLSWFGPRARDAAPALRDLLNDERRQIRLSAAVALASIDPTAVDAIPILVDAMKRVQDEELDTLFVSAALAKFGPKARAAIPVLTDLVKGAVVDDDAGWYVRNCLKELILIDPEGKEILPLLLAALKCKDAEAIEGAASCLGLLGPRAREAVPALVLAMTRDLENWSIHGSEAQAGAARAIRRVDPDAQFAIPFLIPTLRYRHVPPKEREAPAGFGSMDRDVDDSGAAAGAEVLGSYGSRAKAAVPALLQAMQTSEKDNANWQLQRAAITALGQIGPDARAAIPSLRSLVAEGPRGSPDEIEALVSLVRIDPEGKSLAEKWLRTPADVRGGPYDTTLQIEARVRLLGALGRTSLEGDWLTRHELEFLDKQLAYDDPSGEVDIENYEWWFQKIARYGPGARLAIPRLKEYRKHRSPWVRMWAKEALGRIKKN